MDQRDAVGREQAVHLVEERAVMRQADVLEHADRDDAVEAAGQRAIVNQLETHMGRRTPAAAARARATLSCSADSVIPVTSTPATRWR